jgi:hypothetical protein
MNSSRHRRGQLDFEFDERRATAPIANPYGEDNIETFSASPAVEELDGQLGPDELPDPEEVVMNLEAKRHH